MNWLRAYFLIGVRCFSKNSNWEDMRRVLESSNSFIHHKMNWRTVKWIDSWYHPQRLYSLLSLRSWSFPTEYKIEVIFYYSILCYIYELEMHYFSLIIIDSSFIFLIFMNTCFELWLKLNTISRNSSLWAWITHFLKYSLSYYYITYSDDIKIEHGSMGFHIKLKP